jgi:hypothetical protein
LKRALGHLALIALIYIPAWIWAPNEIDPSPYRYDESDYLYAASRGFVANWSDAPAVSLIDFVKIGVSRGADPAQTSGLSTLLRDSGDMNGYRHWHGPIYYYGLILAWPLARNEYGMRRLSLAAPLLGLAVTYAGCLWLWPGAQGTLAAMLSSALFIWNPATIKTTEIAPHLLFAAVSLASMFAAAKMLQSGHRVPWYAALALAGVAFCTMELAFALILSVLWCGYLERTRLRPDRELVTKSLVALGAPIVLLWPASLYKLTFIKSYLAMAYLAVFRKNPWGDVTFAQTWAFRGAAMPVTWIVIAVALVLFFRWRAIPERRPSSAFLIFGLVMLAAVLRVNSTGWRYMLPFLPPLLVFAGCLLAAALCRLRTTWRWSLAAALALLLWFDATRLLRPSPIPADPRATALLASVRDPRWENKTLLVPQDDLPALHFYFPRTVFRGYLSATSIPSRLAGEHFDGVIYPEDPTVRTLY